MAQPVTPEDVIFTYETFTAKGRPPYSKRMDKIAKIEKTGERGVKFTFNEKSDREFPLIIALNANHPETCISRRHLMSQRSTHSSVPAPI